MRTIVVCLFCTFFISCKKESAKLAEKYTSPVAVTINGYSDHLMEPFLSRDGSLLFFNNSNDPSVNTDLHWAKKIDKTTFEYQGKLKGVNSGSLEGVASLDSDNRFYFISTRSYGSTYSTIYSGYLIGDSVSNDTIVKNISQNTNGMVNFDAEISADGTHLYFVNSEFNDKGQPKTADLVMAEKNGTEFSVSDYGKQVFSNVNTNELEYAPAISKDELTLYFTRVKAPITSDSKPEIYVSKRKSKNKAFEKGVKIEAITGFVEGPTLTADEKGIYFHKLDNDSVFRLYLANFN